MKLGRSLSLAALPIAMAHGQELMVPRWLPARIELYSAVDGALLDPLFIDLDSLLNLGGAIATPFEALVDPRTPRLLSTTSCTQLPNSTGVPGEISASGSNYVRSHDVTLSAESLPPNTFGFFLTSQADGLVIQPGGSQGNLCLSGAIGRYVGPGQVQSTGATGTMSLALDLDAAPTPVGLVPVTAGQVWYYQAWHRDLLGGALTSNFTSALKIANQ